MNTAAGDIQYKVGREQHQQCHYYVQYLAQLIVQRKIQFHLSTEKLGDLSPTLRHNTFKFGNKNSISSI